jgi:CubicO group peptidase (beta-lactamase class C family)
VTGSNRREFLAVVIASATSHAWSKSWGNERDGDAWPAHGLTVEQRDQIRAAFRRGIDQKAIPGGNLLLIHKGESVFREAFGSGDIESGRLFEVDTPCRIASLTKPHTATTMVMLAEREQLSLNIPVEEYLPVFKGIRVRGGEAARRSPTLLECLSHTTGFPGNNALKRGDVEIEFGESLEDAVNDLASRELLAEPGTRHAYSRLGYMVAGRVAEVVTGKPFPEVMRDELLKPIGATDATFEPTHELLERMATPYERTNGGFTRRVGERLSGAVMNPGGSLISTLDSVGRLMQLHRNHGSLDGRPLVRMESLNQMYVAQPTTPGTGYGLGFNIMKKRADGTASRIRHTGASGTLAFLDFDRDLIAIILTQVPQTQTIRWRNQLVRTIDTVFA